MSNEVAVSELSLVRNRKTGSIYEMMGFVRNATNAQDGQRMQLYRLRGTDLLYVREESEFLTKFEPCAKEKDHE